MVLIVVFDEVVVDRTGKRELWYGFGYEGRVEGLPSG